MPLHTVTDGTGAQINFEISDPIAPHDIFFIHGNLASNNWWRPVEKAIRTRTQNTNCKGRLIFAEFRGCGKSSRPLIQSHVSMKIFANDFIDLLNSLDLEPLYVVGHSTGGLIAALMMAQNPKMFRGGFLLDPVGARGIHFDDSMNRAFTAMKNDRSLLAAILGSTIYGLDSRDSFFNHVLLNDAQVAVANVGALVLKALDGLDVSKEILQIQASATVAHGEKDVLLPKQDSEELASLLPNGRFIELEGCGHCANVEKPEYLVDKIFQSFFE